MIGGYTVVVLPWYEVSFCDPEQLRGVLRARLGAVGNAQRSWLHNGEIGDVRGWSKAMIYRGFNWLNYIYLFNHEKHGDYGDIIDTWWLLDYRGSTIKVWIYVLDRFWEMTDSGLLRVPFTEANFGFRSHSTRSTAGLAKNLWRFMRTWSSYKAVIQEEALNGEISPVMRKHWNHWIKTYVFFCFLCCCSPTAKLCYGVFGPD